MLKRAWLMTLLSIGGALAQRPSYPVILDAREVYSIAAADGNLSAKDRAADVSAVLLSVAQDPAEPKLRIVSSANESIILAGRTFVCVVSDADAAVEGRNRAELATARASQIAAALASYNESRRVWRMARNGAIAIAIWVLFALAAWALRWLYTRALALFTRQYENWATLRKWFGIAIPLAVRTALIAAALTLGLAAFSAALSRSLALFPATAGLSESIFQFIGGAFGHGLRRVVNYLPNLAVVILLCTGTWYAIRFLRFLSRRLEKGELTIRGFHPEWSTPTARIFAFLLIMAALVAVFPYLPGGDSPALRGISIFIGVLVSFGSGSAMGNVIAGIILTYMRPFRVGDRVKIADGFGDIVEQNLLVTRIRTIKNVEIVLPNSLILNAQILNYSADARARGLILHTSITIGYDAPWRRVHELLIEAALATTGVLSEPRPFVFQTALNDFNVSYEINAYTNLPNEMARIYSDLHTSIQESFNRGGVEIMSPNFLALRDGRESTIPKFSA